MYIHCTLYIVQLYMVHWNEFKYFGRFPSIRSNKNKVWRKKKDENNLVKMKKKSLTSWVHLLLHLIWWRKNAIFVNLDKRPTKLHYRNDWSRHLIRVQKKYVGIYVSIWKNVCIKAFKYTLSDEKNRTTVAAAVATTNYYDDDNKIGVYHVYVLYSIHDVHLLFD